jgi:hypothetical protein
VSTEISTELNTGKDSDDDDNDDGNYDNGDGDDEFIYSLFTDDILIENVAYHQIKFIDIHKWQETNNLEKKGYLRSPRI